jgi:uncharacterized protein (TIGR02452 family)
MHFSHEALSRTHSINLVRVVLGAWGCGVFRNDPLVVAAAFAGHLRHGEWRGRFDRVLFSVLDTSQSKETLAAFERAVG